MDSHPQEICRDFQRTGKCRFGDNCKHSHAQGPQANLATQQEEQADRLDCQMTMLQGLLATITGDIVDAIGSAVADECGARET